MQHRYSSRTFAFENAATTVPALIGIQYNGGLLFLRIGHQDIGSAYLHTLIASIAYSWVKIYGPVWGGRVGNHIGLTIHARSPPRILEFRQKPRNQVFRYRVTDFDTYGDVFEGLFRKVRSKNLVSSAPYRVCPSSRGSLIGFTRRHCVRFRDRNGAGSSPHRWGHKGTAKDSQAAIRRP